MRDRRDKAAVEWAADVIGAAKVVRKELQSRWRPHWTLQIEDVHGNVNRVLLRGFRNPGYTEADDEGARRFLEREAGVLAALQKTDLKVPSY